MARRTTTTASRGARARKVPPVAEMPVTRAMLLGVRNEVIERIIVTSARIDETNARIDQTNARLDQTNARIDQTNARLDQTNARIDELRAEVHVEIAAVRAEIAAVRGEVAAVRAEVHRIAVMVEEQESRNRVVLEVVQGHNARFERLEAGLAEVRDLLRALVQQR